MARRSWARWRGRYGFGARLARLAGDHRFRQLRVFTRRYLRQYTRSPLSVAFLVAWPAFWYLVVAHLLLRPGTADGASRAAAKAALAVSFGLFGALTVSLTGVVGSFTADIQTKRYRKLRSLPVRPAADLGGRFLAGTGLSLVAYLGLLAVGALDGAAFALREPWSPVVVATGVVAFTAVGIAMALGLAALVPRPEYATMLATVVLLVGFFGTGFNGVSPALFPGPGWLLNVVPVTAITRAQLYHLVDPRVVGAGAFGPPSLPSGVGALVIVVGSGAGSLLAGAWLLGRAVYRGEVGE